MEKPGPAYLGDDDYVFVSYAHSNASTVYGELTRLQSEGMKIWYDEGISPGSRWTQEIADAIERCKVFIAFVSADFVGSENCVNEVEFAVSKGKRIIQVYLEPTTLPSGLELSLSGRQAILKYSLAASTYETQFANLISDFLQDSSAGVQPRIPQQSVSRRKTNILAGIVVVALLATGIFVINQDRESTVDFPDRRPAIAVLPFENLTESEENKYFAEGLADDLIVRLGAWQSLPVVARASSFDPSLGDNAKEIGGKLDARYLVQGSLRDVGDELKLSIHVVDSSSGRNVWSQEFREPIGRAFEMQQSIAESIVGEINPALLTLESNRAARANAANIDAWTSAMRGWWHLNTETREGLEESRQWFSRAIELDATWGWPHAALGLSYFRAVINGWAENPRQAVGLLIREAGAAVQLDPQDSFAHHALGHAYAIQGQIDLALSALERGVELGPHNAMANSCYGMQLASANRGDEAIPYADHAMAISPNDPWQHRFALVRARGHFANAQYAEAEDWSLRSLQLRPGTGAFLHSVASPALAGEIERATQRVDEARERSTIAPLGAIQAGFAAQTHAEYLSRLIEGLRLAGFSD